MQFFFLLASPRAGAIFILQRIFSPPPFKLKLWHPFFFYIIVCFLKVKKGLLWEFLGGELSLVLKRCLRTCTVTGSDIKSSILFFLRVVPHTCSPTISWGIPAPLVLIDIPVIVVILALRVWLSHGPPRAVFPLFQHHHFADTRSCIATCS